MPQTSEENFEHVSMLFLENDASELESLCFYYLRDRGWSEERFILKPPLRSLTEDETQCMLYLVQEWDYGVHE